MEWTTTDDEPAEGAKHRAPGDVTTSASLTFLHLLEFNISVWFL